VRAGLGGAIVAVLFMLAVFAIGNWATGDRFPALDDILSDLVIAVVFGGIAAGGSMWLAQRGETASIAGPDRHERLAAGSGPFRASDSGHHAHAPARSED
jgi:hypothetical protein